MKRKLLLLLFTPVSIYFILSINSCRKADRDDDNETQSAADNGNAQQIFNDIFKQVAYYADTNSIFKLAATASCDTSWVTGTTFPETLTIKYDTITGCTDAAGIIHKGKVNAVFTKKLTDSLSVTTISFKDFYRNNYKITGTQTITNKGIIGGKPNFSVNISNGLITAPDGKTITWNAQLTYKLIAGDTTNTFSDDVFAITGTSNGVGIKGTSFSGTITNALRFELSCNYITSGTLTISPGTLDTRIVDFGGGACDNSCTIKLTGKTYTITTLP